MMQEIRKAFSLYVLVSISIAALLSACGNSDSENNSGRSAPTVQSASATPNAAQFNLDCSQASSAGTALGGSGNTTSSSGNTTTVSTGASGGTTVTTGSSGSTTVATGASGSNGNGTVTVAGPSGSSGALITQSSAISFSSSCASSSPTTTAGTPGTSGALGASGASGATNTSVQGYQFVNNRVGPVSFLPNCANNTLEVNVPNQAQPTHVNINYDGTFQANVMTEGQLDHDDMNNTPCTASLLLTVGGTVACPNNSNITSTNGSSAGTNGAISSGNASGASGATGNGAAAPSLAAGASGGSANGNGGGTVHSVTINANSDWTFTASNALSTPNTPGALRACVINTQCGFTAPVTVSCGL